MARVNGRLSKDGRPLLQRFLRPLLDTEGGYAAIARMHVELEGLSSSVNRQYADRYARMLRPGGPFPEASTVWRLAKAVQRHHAWCAPPLALLGVGHLAAFIDVFSDGALRLSRTRARQLLRAAPAAVDGTATARKTWVLTTAEAHNFRDPYDCANIATVDSDEVRVARHVAGMFDIPFARRQEIALKHLDRWLSECSEAE